MLNASIVLYNTPQEQVQYILRQLLACEQLAVVFIIDNSPKPSKIKTNSRVRYIFNGKNLGYGAAHNIALRESIREGVPFHLVLNTDLQFEPQTITHLLRFAEETDGIGAIMPKVVSPDGQIQYLGRLLPTPFDLILRRFLPSSWCKKRRERYELRHNRGMIMNVPYLSGCFMLLSVKALEEVGLFDERFFMYPEDIDLTRRLYRKYFYTLYYPQAVIVHAHAQASYHSPKMLWIHIVNMCKYFNKWGWFIDKERKLINKLVLSATQP